MVGGNSLFRSVAGFGPTFRRNAASTTQSNNTVFHRVFGTTNLKSSKYPIMCGEEIMSTKAHGTSEKPGKVLYLARLNESYYLIAFRCILPSERDLKITDIMRQN